MKVPEKNMIKYKIIVAILSRKCYNPVVVNSQKILWR